MFTLASRLEGEGWDRKEQDNLLIIVSDTKHSVYATLMESNVANRTNVEDLSNHQTFKCPNSWEALGQ